MDLSPTGLHASYGIFAVTTCPELLSHLPVRRLWKGELGKTAEAKLQSKKKILRQGVAKLEKVRRMRALGSGRVLN